MYTDVVKNLRATFPFLKAYMFHFLENKVVLMYTQDAQAHDNLIDDIALQNSLRHDIKALLQVDHLLFFAGFVKESSTEMLENPEDTNWKFTHVGGFVPLNRRINFVNTFKQIVNIRGNTMTDFLSLLRRIINKSFEKFPEINYHRSLLEFVNNQVVIFQSYPSDLNSTVLDQSLKDMGTEVLFIPKEICDSVNRVIPLIFFIEGNTLDINIPEKIHKSILLTDEARSDLAIISDVQFGVKVIRFD
jgi:hypothetical protein